MKTKAESKRKNGKLFVIILSVLLVLSIAAGITLAIILKKDDI